MLTDAGIGLEEVTADGADVYWIESRPLDGGRSVIVRRTPDGTIIDVSPEGFNARTRVHEYGGGAYAVRDRIVIASRMEDQRVYRLDEADPIPITPNPDLPAGDRYADYVFHGNLIICVRERHRSSGEAVNQLVAFPIDYSSPRVSPGGSFLAWLTWDHPNMPWDGTELWVAELASDGTVSNRERVAGGSDESLFQPEWSPDGRLHFVSDRNGWWNLYRLEQSGEVAALCPMEAEFGVAQIQFGYRRYAFVNSTQIVATIDHGGFSRFVVLEDRELRSFESGLDAMSATMAVADGRAWTVAAGAIQPAAVVGIDPHTGDEQVVRTSVAIDIDEGYVSRPQPITFPTGDDAVAHAFYYPPTNTDFVGPDDELPPLVVWAHGGPTGAAAAGFTLGRQFWTSRGFGLVDVNYRGSTGYGRTYRRALRGLWGVLDTDDCIAAARYLAGQRLVDEQRMAIRGGSAGGYTTLCALTFHDDFATGASYFGVADLAALAEETHKFESRYMDSMVGPYPEAADVYRDRSPIHHTGQLSKPMLILQGLDDKVVLPDQAERMVEALDRNAIPYTYLLFEGEGHGFRKAENIEASVKAELLFYSWVFGFAPTGELGPIEIHHRAVDRSE
jgi:dipeptidyl aminopeptidase/acylaminoacyl peptidase